MNTEPSSSLVRATLRLRDRREEREREVLVTDVQTVVLPPAKWRTDDSGREEMTLAVSWSGTLSSEEG